MVHERVRESRVYLSHGDAGRERKSPREQRLPDLVPSLSLVGTVIAISIVVPPHARTAVRRAPRRAVEQLSRRAESSAALEVERDARGGREVRRGGRGGVLGSVGEVGGKDAAEEDGDEDGDDDCGASVRG